jgi:hypothetical protein
MLSVLGLLALEFKTSLCLVVKCTCKQISDRPRQDLPSFLSYVTYMCLNQGKACLCPHNLTQPVR